MIFVENKKKENFFEYLWINNHCYRHWREDLIFRSKTFMKVQFVKNYKWM